MPAHLSVAEARRLGLTAPAAPRTTRRASPSRGNYGTVCHDCGETFTTMAGETRHVEATRHARYELPLPALPSDAADAVLSRLEGS